MKLLFQVVITTFIVSMLYLGSTLFIENNILLNWDTQSLLSFYSLSLLIKLRSFLLRSNRCPLHFCAREQAGDGIPI